MKNALVSKILYEIADLLEMKGEDFKPQAYRKAAREIEALAEPVEDISRAGGLEGIPGVGRGIAEKIKEIVDTGRLEYYESLKKDFPVDIDALLSVEGIGPKKAKIFYKELGVRKLEDLEKAAKAGRIRKLPGMGEKTEKRILGSVEFAMSGGGRRLLGIILPVAEKIEADMKKMRCVKRAVVAGSLRRMKETVGDIDVLVVTDNPKSVMETFVSMGNVAEIVEKGASKSTVRLDEGIECDLRVVPPESFGSALIYFTGSKEHNVALRRVAISKGWKLNEYGLFSGNDRLAGRTEKQVYGNLGMQYIEPEMRENTGEVELARKKGLPKIIGYGDVKGDLHMHTKWSDGSGTVEEMVVAAKNLGREYVCITDHAGKMKIVNAMGSNRVMKYASEVEHVSEKIDGIYVMVGVEIDILRNGKFDVDKKVLEGMDLVIASVHSGFNESRNQITERIIGAMESGLVDVIGHPTGRKIGIRKSYDFDMDAVLDAAKRTGTALEINSQPVRSDLSSENVRIAVERGCMLSIGTDAHNPSQLDYLTLGSATARRGWVKKNDVLNALPLKKLMKFIG